MGKRNIWESVIDPLAGKLEEIVNHWHRFGVAPPHPTTLEFLYRDHHVDFAVNWLKINVSTDFAEEFRRTLYEPLEEYRKLDAQARAMEPGTRCASEVYVKKVIRDRHEFLSKRDPDAWVNPDEDSVLSVVEAGYVSVGQKLAHALDYLWQVSALLRGRFHQAATAVPHANNGAPKTPRYQPPACPKCKGKSRVQSSDKNVRKLKCKKCKYTWTASR